MVKAAPVKWDQEIVYHQPKAQAIVCNSGIANACTGEEGLGCCKETAEAAAEILGIPAESVLVASTGVIGMQLPIQKLTDGVKAMAPVLSGSLQAGNLAAKAIMTTDTVEKEAAVQVEIGGKTVTVGGMCKGSGHDPPKYVYYAWFCYNRCEYLQGASFGGFKTGRTGHLQYGFRRRRHFDKRYRSLLANGMAGNLEITEKNKDYQTFCEALNYANTTCKKNCRRWGRSHCSF